MLYKVFRKVQWFINFVQYAVSLNIRLYRRYKYSRSIIRKNSENNDNSSIQKQLVFYSIYDIKVL